MGERIKRLVDFLKVGIWTVDRHDVSPVRYIVYEVIRKLLLAIECFTTKRMIDSAGYLTYSTHVSYTHLRAHET